MQSRLLRKLTNAELIEALNAANAQHIHAGAVESYATGDTIRIIRAIMQERSMLTAYGEVKPCTK
jgi:hypothetical protein